MRIKSQVHFALFGGDKNILVFFGIFYALKSAKRTWMKTDLPTKNLIYILLFFFVEKDLYLFTTLTGQVEFHLRMFVSCDII